MDNSVMVEHPIENCDILSDSDSYSLISIEDQDEIITKNKDDSSNIEKLLLEKIKILEMQQKENQIKIKKLENNYKKEKIINYEKQKTLNAQYKTNAVHNILKKNIPGYNIDDNKDLSKIILNNNKFMKLKASEIAEKILLKAKFNYQVFKKDPNISIKDLVKSSAGIIGWYNHSDTEENLNHFNELKEKYDHKTKLIRDGNIKLFLDKSISDDLRKNSKIPKPILNDLFNIFIENKDNIKRINDFNNYIFYYNDEIKNESLKWFYNIFMNEYKIYKRLKLFNIDNDRQIMIKININNTF